MQYLERFLNFLDSLLGSALYFPLVLLGMGVFFTFYLGFPQIRYFKHAWGILLGKRADNDAPGETTPLSGAIYRVIGHRGNR